MKYPLIALLLLLSLFADAAGVQWQNYPTTNTLGATDTLIAGNGATNVTLTVSVAIATIAQPAINTTSNTLNTLINTSSNLNFANTQTAINTTSNTLNTLVNTSSNLVYGNANTAINTSSNSVVVALPPRTNYVAFTNDITAGQAIVIVGRDQYGSVLTKATNWPSGSSGGISALYATNDIIFDTNTINSQAFRLDTNLVVHISTNGVDVVSIGTNGVSIATGNTNFFGGISFVASNAAPFSTVAPSGLDSIIMNKRWTNDFNRQADLVINISVTDAATGVPILAFTNTITGESYTNSPNFGITGTPIYNVNYIDISPGDYGSFSNYSTGTGTAITINSAWWKLK